MREVDVARVTLTRRLTSRDVLARQSVRASTSLDVKASGKGTKDAST